MSQQNSVPIAVVGTACRLPGGIDSPTDLWRALDEGRDMVGTIPPDRFSARQFTGKRGTAGVSYTEAGGFLRDVRGFDANFFGVSAREASRMDPQQRLMLELTVEALDDAGIDRGDTAGSDTAVFVGVGSHDWGDLQAANLKDITAYTMIGSTIGNTANRVSYLMDWHGQSVAMDTACSSSLTALHQACELLRAGNARMALAAGVNVNLSPTSFVGYSAASMLSPSGRCRAFSADADGYVRSEGAVVLLLKRLDDALADGDRIHGVLLATAVNSDGRTSGMSLPSGTAQEALLREVYGAAGVAPDDVCYFEAHGTGTPAGDPIECGAIGRALGILRTRGPLPVGSVKSNLGHLEAASGITGVLKALLVIRHGRVPKTLNALPLNPRIDFAALGLAPATESVPLPDDGRRIVGVNSFGFGGANAHAVLAAPPAAPAAEKPQPTSVLLASARTEEALADACARLATRLETAQQGEFADLAYSTHQRQTHERRTAVLACDAGQAAAALRAAAAGEDLPAGAATGEAAMQGRVGFVFCGNGSQWAGMGRDLLASEPAFRSAVESADLALRPLLGWSVLEEMESGSTAGESATRWRGAEYGQPLLFAVQVGMVAWLRHHRVRPQAVAGHSVGEMAAAWASGALTLEQAAAVVAARSRAQAATAGQGRMAAVGLSEDQARQEEVVRRGLVEIAGINSPVDVTLAGPAGPLEELGERLAGRGTFHRMLDVDHAYHSSQMDTVEKPLRAALADLTSHSPKITFVSTVTGQPVDGSTELDAEYWWRNVRAPVRFADAVQGLLADGCDVLVEIGPHPVLAPYLRRSTALSDTPVTVLATGHRDGAESDRLRTALAALHVAGAVPAPTRSRSRTVVDLPAYPWQRTDIWNGDPSWWTGAPAETRDSDHPLLAGALPGPNPAWSCPLTVADPAWLSDHRIDDAAVMPAAAFLEIAAATLQVADETPVQVQHLSIEHALAVPESTVGDDPGSRLRMQVVTSTGGTVRVLSRRGVDGEWTEHARARARALPAGAGTPGNLDPAAEADRLGAELPIAEFYEDSAKLGLQFGTGFRTLESMRHANDAFLARYRGHLDPAGYRAAPFLLDAVLQACSWSASLRTGEENALFLPATVADFRLWGRMPADGWIHGRLRESGALEVSFDVVVTDREGCAVAELGGVRLRRYAGSKTAPPQQLRTVLRALPDSGAVSTPPPAPTHLIETAGSTLRRALTPTKGPDPEDQTRRIGEIRARCAVQALHQLTGGSAFTLADLLAAEVLPTYLPLAEVLAELGVRHGLLKQDSGRSWSFTDRGAEANPQPALSAAVDAMPHRAAELALLDHCSAALPDVLRGRTNPRDLLFSEQDRFLLEQYYTAAGDVACLNAAAVALVNALSASWPADQPLRVLEVGGGTGSTLAALVDTLPAERARYMFTDVSVSFLARARTRFASYDFLDFTTLDIDRDPAEQGFSPGSFDLVIATNVLHAAQDLTAALARVHELLTPGGLLLAVEHHDPALHALTTGLLEEFWAVTDTEERPRSPLASPQQWQRLLAAAGYDDTRLLHPATTEGSPAESLILTRRPLAASAPVACDLPADNTGAEEEATDWILACEPPHSQAAAELAAALRTQTSDACRIVPLTETSPAAWQEVLATAPRPHVVLVLEGPATEGEAVLDTAVARLAALGTLAGCEAFLGAAQPRLTLITRPCGALPAPDQATHIADAVPWGAARTFANECPTVQVRRIAFEPGGDIRRLSSELCSAGDEDEVLLTARGRFAPRLTAVPPTGRPDGPYQLQLRAPGLNPDLAWSAAPRPQPGPGEVLIEVHAAGLNYRDAMLATGRLPAGAEAALPGAGLLGMECAGVVTEVGAGVSAFAPGDRVMAAAAHTFASHVVADVRTTTLIPDHMDFTAAATMPVVFFTVHHALFELARLKAGETVLVHGGAGGVGLAVLQAARLVGAKVIATAGTPAKRQLLRTLGVDHVLDSRTVDFTHEVPRLTGGRGVDVAVNSLAEDGQTRTLELLRPGGRFIELGKRDIYADRPLPQRLLRDNIAFFAVDAAQLMADPADAADTFRALGAHLAEGAYWPLPHRVHPAGDAAYALRLLQHSRHLGKVVVDFIEPPAVERDTALTPVLDTTACYLVTGGTSGLGAATARWLARHGARRLALVSRRGPKAPGADALLAELRALGAETHLYAADAADAAALRSIAAKECRGGIRLGGIVHSTLHTDDTSLKDLTHDQIRTALGPKVLGALTLDDLADADSLFLAHSTVVATVGQLGLAGYSAANLFLEALAHRRRRSGRHAAALAWGMIADTGYTAREEQVRDRLTSIGLGGLTSREVERSVLPLLTGAGEHRLVGRFDWGRMARVLPAMRSPRFGRLIDDNRATDPTGTTGSPAHDGPAEALRRLGAADADERLRYVTEVLVATLAYVVQTDPARIQPRTRLAALGIDSLMAVEIVVNIRSRLGCDLPTLEVMNSTSVTDLARNALSRLSVPAAGRA